MIPNLLHQYGHPVLYVLVVVGALITLGGVIWAGKHHQPNRKERARRRARASRAMIYARSEERPHREPIRGLVPARRTEEGRPKTMPFAPGGYSPLKTPKAATIVPFEPEKQKEENKGIRTPLAPTSPDLKQSGS